MYRILEEQVLEEHSVRRVNIYPDLAAITGQNLRESINKYQKQVEGGAAKTGNWKGRSCPRVHT